MSEAAPDQEALEQERADLEAARAAGIHRLDIPTPFQVGRVNCYLIEDDPLTLVDTGPNSGKALDELTHQIEALGHSIEDLESIVLTHQHIDHVGLAEILARNSGAEVVAIRPLAGFLANYSRDAELDDEFAAALMRAHGIPDDVTDALRSVSRSFRGWGAGCDVSRQLDDGEVLDLRDRRLEVQLRPGHSPTDTLFWDNEREILLGGDHLIAHISSNPLVTRPPDRQDAEAAAGERPHALRSYLDSLAQTRELPAGLILPGHGAPITNHAELIDQRFAMHERRATRIAGLIAEKPSTAYEIARKLWGNVAVTQAFLTISEVLGHVDLLIERGEAVERDQDGVIHFETLRSAA